MTIAASVLLASVPLLVSFYANRFQEHDKNEAFGASTTDFGLPVEEEFDFIVVGAGAAGCVLARRLAEANFTVLLLEAGGHAPPLLDVPLLSKFTKNLPEVNFLFHSTPQKHAGLDRNGVIATPAGRMLGGSSAENDLIFQRGHPNDFDNWAELTGDPTWGHEEVGKYFDLVDKQMLWKSYANVESYDNKDVWLAAGKERGFEEPDANGLGFSTVQRAVNGSHHRLNAYQAYIGSSTNLGSRLTLRQYSLASKILIENKAAEGVIYERHGVPRVAYAKNEVILSAGTYMTPAILTRSGIGPEKTLSAANIDPIAVLPVGENLMDHLTLEVGPFKVNPENVWSLQHNLTFGDLKSFEAFGNGSLSESLQYGKSVFSMPSSRARDIENRPTYPDLQIYYSNMSNDTFGVKCVVVLNRPYSRGRLDVDPKVTPIGHNSSVQLHYNYLSDASDVDVMVEGINFCLETIEGTEAFKEIGAKLSTLSVPGCTLLPYRSREYWECYVKQKVDSAYHAAGTCRMGKSDDVRSVVDSKLRVLGVQNLRIADASIMPVITGAGTLAPTMMIAEKLAAELISNYNKGAAEDNSPTREPSAPADSSRNTGSRSLFSNSFQNGVPFQIGPFEINQNLAEFPQQNQFQQPAQNQQFMMQQRQQLQQQEQFRQNFQAQFNQFQFPQQNGPNPMQGQFDFQQEGPQRTNFGRPRFNNMPEGMQYRSPEGFRNGFNLGFGAPGPFPQQNFNAGPFSQDTYQQQQQMPFQNGQQAGYPAQGPSEVMQNLGGVNRYQPPWQQLQERQQRMQEINERGQFYPPPQYGQFMSPQSPPQQNNGIQQPKQMDSLNRQMQNSVPNSLQVSPPESQSQQTPVPTSNLPQLRQLNPDSQQLPLISAQPSDSLASQTPQNLAPQPSQPFKLNGKQEVSKGNEPEDLSRNPTKLPEIQSKMFQSSTLMPSGPTLNAPAEPSGSQTQTSQFQQDLNPNPEPGPLSRNQQLVPSPQQESLPLTLPQQQFVPPTLAPTPQQQNTLQMNQPTRNFQPQMNPPQQFVPALDQQGNSQQNFRPNSYNVPYQQPQFQQPNQSPFNRNFPPNPQYFPQRNSFQVPPPPYLLPLQDSFHSAQLSRSLQQSDDEESSTAAPGLLNVNQVASGDNFQASPNGATDTSIENSTPSLQPAPESPVLKNLMQDVIKVESQPVDPVTSSSSIGQVSSTTPAMPIVPEKMKTSDELIIQSAPSATNLSPSSKSAHVPSLSNSSTLHNLPLGSPMESTRISAIDSMPMHLASETKQSNYNFGYHNGPNATSYGHQYQAPPRAYSTTSVHPSTSTATQQSHSNNTGAIIATSYPHETASIPSNNSTKMATEFKPLLHNTTMTPAHVINKRDVSNNTPSSAHAKRHRSANLMGHNRYRIIE